MDIMFTLPDDFGVDINSERKAIKRLSARDLNLESWPQVSLLKVFAYGIEQIGNDAGSDAKKACDGKADLMREYRIGAFEDKMADLLSGKAAERKSREGDPIMAYMVKCARKLKYESVKAWHAANPSQHDELKAKAEKFFAEAMEGLEV